MGRSQQILPYRTAKFVKGILKGELKIDFLENQFLAHPLESLFDFLGLDVLRNQG